MKKRLLPLLIILTISSHASSLAVEDPIGQRFGMSPIEVVDSVFKEGIYAYSDASVERGASTKIFVDFRDVEGHRSLSYSFEDDKCTIGMLTLPISQLDSVVRVYDRQFPSAGKQMWRSPYGLIKLQVAIGEESVRRDHKPHVIVFYDSRVIACPLQATVQWQAAKATTRLSGEPANRCVNPQNV